MALGYTRLLTHMDQNETPTATTRFGILSCGLEILHSDFGPFTGQGADGARVLPRG